MSTTKSELKELVIEHISDRVANEPSSNCLLVRDLGMEYFEIQEVIIELEETLCIELDEGTPDFYDELSVQEFINHLYKHVEEVDTVHGDDDAVAMFMPEAPEVDIIELTDEEKEEDEFDDKEDDLVEA